MIGLGKLGMPVALAMSLKGHSVMGYDVDRRRMQTESFPQREIGPNGEPSIEPLLRTSSLRFGSLDEVVRHASILFLAIQTPHEPAYEGVTRLPEERRDFDYSFLCATVRDVAAAIEALGEPRTVVVISTVLPGTLRRYIMPLLNLFVRLCYNPYFIAMGTTIRDFLNPEFVLLGVHDEVAAQQVQAFYRTLHDRPAYVTTIENAEMIKVAYNSFITTKICFANTLAEICHKVPGCDIDVVTDALTLATDRLISPRYMRAGMGDGGGCHPRDNIALSWLARQVGLSYDWFEHIMLSREQQADWLAELAIAHHQRRGFSDRWIGIYGRAFKAGTNLVAGSPALLLAELLRERGFPVDMFDPHVDSDPCPFDQPGVYVVATNHPEFAEPDWRFPTGSVIVDPWRYIPERDGIELVRVGRGAPVTQPPISAPLGWADLGLVAR